VTAPAPPAPAPPRRILLAGGTGTIGRATARALRRRGYEVVAFLRPGGEAPAALQGTTALTADITNAAALAAALRTVPPCDALVTCLASRTGTPRDAWAVDHAAQRTLLHAAREAGVTQVVLLSAICVQKPRLAFQHAKLAFERELMASGLAWTIVRPTAFFKSLSGQVRRVQQGKPFLVFGDGTGTACTPISDDDLAEYLVACLDNPARQGRILPIGGPHPALTPRQQGALLCALAGRPVRYTHVPVALLDGIVALLAALGRVIPPLADKAELARIGRYYATESMLVWDAAAGRYDADATPATGTDTLADHYARLLRGEVADDRGDHAVF
jgi:divinyl chlorophyllide a 8-vinyl-reductase